MLIAFELELPCVGVGYVSSGLAGGIRRPHHLCGGGRTYASASQVSHHRGLSVRGWVSQQRIRRDSMSAEQRRRLEGANGWVMASLRYKRRETQPIHLVDDPCVRARRGSKADDGNRLRRFRSGSGGAWLGGRGGANVFYRPDSRGEAVQRGKPQGRLSRLGCRAPA